MGSMTDNSYSTENNGKIITGKASVLREAQLMLTRLSQNSGKYSALSPLHIGGTLDEATKKDIEQFQRIEGMEVSGLLDIDTYNALKNRYSVVREEFSAPYGIAPPRSALQKGIFPGERSENVMLIQLILYSLSTVMETAGNVSLSGIYDNATETAIRELQRIWRIEENGYVDTVTWNRLSRLYGRYNGEEEL